MKPCNEVGFAINRLGTDPRGWPSQDGRLPAPGHRAPDVRVQSRSLFMKGFSGGQGRNRTADTMIFSHVLYQLSYLAKSLAAGSEQKREYNMRLRPNSVFASRRFRRPRRQDHPPCTPGAGRRFRY